jgi:heptosyltransferase III
MIKKVLIIIRQANGDVLLASPIVKALQEEYSGVRVDLVVNESTLSMAKAISGISEIYPYCYSWRKKGIFYRIFKELQLFIKLWKKYDIALSLTAADRSILLALTSGKRSVGPVEPEQKKSWWKRKCLTHHYFFDPNSHIILNNRKALECLKIGPATLELKGQVDPVLKKAMQERLDKLGIKKFIIFHPSARESYKVYPEDLRHELLSFFNQAKIPVVITGIECELDLKISRALPELPYLYNFVGKCASILELMALMDLSEAYVGMDTLNMHLAASLNKPIFAIFGPTNSRVWSPWSNALQSGAGEGALAVRKYGNVTLFQANLPCVPCFKAGCDDRGGKSECLSHISPAVIWRVFSEWWRSKK